MSILSKMLLLKNKIIVNIAEYMLPSRYYIQEIPYRSIYCGQYSEFHASSYIFNYRPDKVSRDGVRWMMIRLLLDHVKNLDHGDYAELGTFRGKTAKIIYDVLPNHTFLYCFDTFFGFMSCDVIKEKEYSKIPVNEGIFKETSESFVKDYILKGVDDERLVLVKGYFPDTFIGLEDRSWRFVHLDCDLAEPTRAGLECFWPRLVPGGIVLVHDFNGYFSEGLQKVVWDFCKKNKVTPVPMCDNGGSVVLAKPLRG